jgi:hypothetical protein
MDETSFASPLAGSIVNKLTRIAAVRRRSMMLRPTDGPGLNCYANRREDCHPEQATAPAARTKCRKPRS